MSPMDTLRRGSPRRLNALLVYLILEGASSLFFQLTVTIYVVYWTTTAGFDPLQIVTVAAVFEATIFLFEIPTGVVADVYSRRLSILIGFTLAGLALLLEGVFPVFGVILIAEVLSGIGATFLSGATQAWIAGEVGEASAGEAFVRGAQVRTIGAMVGIVASVALASIHLSLPIIASGVLLLVLAGFLALVMPETNFQPAQPDERSTWRAMAATMRGGLKLVRLNRALLFILAIGVVVSFHSEGIDQLWQAHFLEGFVLPPLGSFDPVVWFGIIGFGANLLSLALHEVVRRRANLSDHTSTAKILMIVYGLVSLGVFAFALAENFALAAAAYWFVTALRALASPVSDAWLNQNIDPKLRATMFSMAGQVGSLGEIAGGLPAGAIGKFFSLRAALAASGAVLLLVMPLFAAALGQQNATSGELRADEPQVKAG